MNKENVTKIVNEVILDKITQMIESMSNQDFTEYIMDKLEQEGINVDTDNEEVVDEIHEIIGDRMTPLIVKMTEYLCGKNIPVD